MKYVIIAVLIAIAIPMAMSASSNTLDAKLSASFIAAVQK